MFLKHNTLQKLMVCSTLAICLLLDGSGLFRMVLLCSVLHECGHILAFFLYAKRLPHIDVHIGGLVLSGAQTFPRRGFLLVTAAGPLCNFVVAALFLLKANSSGSYFCYFGAGTNLCVACYNLLPIGVLDGARLVQAMIPIRYERLFYNVQKILLYAICFLIVCVNILSPLQPIARASSLLAASYLLLAQHNAQ